MAGIEEIKNTIAAAFESGALEPTAKNRSATVKQWEAYGWDDDCPVVPLGMNEDVFYYLDSLHQLRPMKAEKHSRNNILSLFGDKSGYLYEKYGIVNKSGEIERWNVTIVGEMLMAECASRGIIDVAERVRGAGGWRDGNDLVMHCGDMIYFKDREVRPGRIGEYFYPATSKRPAPAAHDEGESAGLELLEILKSWNWRRPDIDPYLLLGWIGAAMMGGALDWRPMVWVTGDKATGKSTLHTLIERVIGSSGLIAASDATAAGLWQYLGHASLPVTLDELEAEEDNKKGNNIIKLARHAASGGETLRGGQDHKGSSFLLRSAFLFSSILIPPLLSQDISRMALLELDRLDSSLPPDLDEVKLAKIGRSFRRRLLDRWDEFKLILPLYRECLANKGHSGRSCDQFGTLLAVQHLLIEPDKPNSGYLEDWGNRMDRATLAEAADDIGDWERCIHHLRTSLVDIGRGEKRSVASILLRAANWTDPPSDDPASDMKYANKQLATVGMKVRKDDGNYWLFVSNTHCGLSRLFEASGWAGRAGATSVWAQSLRRCDGAVAGVQCKMDGANQRCTKVLLSSIVEGD